MGKLRRRESIRYKGCMLDISFWLRFPLLLKHPDFVSAALEECKAAIQNTEVRLAQWKQRFISLSTNPATSLEDLSLCSQEFIALSDWIDKETMRVLSRTIRYSYTIVKSTWKGIIEIEDLDRLAGLHQILRAAAEKCRSDVQRVKGEEKTAVQKLGSLVEKALKDIKKRVETLFPGELDKLEKKTTSNVATLTGVQVQV